LEIKIDQIGFQTKITHDFKENEVLDQPTTATDVMAKMALSEEYTANGSSMDDMIQADKKMKLHSLSYILFSANNRENSQRSGLEFSLKLDSIPMNMMVEIQPVGKDEYRSQFILNRNNLYTKHVSGDIEFALGDKQVKFLINHKPYDRLNMAYLLEKSNDNRLFEAIGAPLIFNKSSEDGKRGQIAVTDSLDRNYTDYYYRLVSLDAFGFRSEPSETIVISGRDMTPPPAVKSASANEPLPNKVRISWKHEIEPDLAGYQVVASKTEDGQYDLIHKPLLKPGTEFFEKEFTTDVPLYYRVIAVDTSNNASISDMIYLIRYDSIPPALPKAIQAKCDSNFVVQIRWQAPDDEDLKGFRVYKSFQPDAGFVSLTPKPLLEPFFVDSLSKNRINKKVFYQISSLDKHYNHSMNSETIVVVIPDILPPTSPLLISAELNEDARLSLSWKPSSSGDVEKYAIYSLAINSRSTDTIYSECFGNIDHQYEMNLNSQERENYEIRITAIDSSGLESKASNAKRVIFKPKPNKVVPQLISLNPLDQGGVELKWSGDSESKTLVYRKFEDGSLELIGRVDRGNSFIDNSTLSSGSYSYQIAHLLANGSKTPLSVSMSLEL